MIELQEFERAVSQSPHQLALSRMEYLNDDSNQEKCGGCEGGLAQQLVRVLEEALDAWKTNNSNETNERLRMILAILRNIHSADTALSEEVARHPGSLNCLRKLLRVLDDNGVDEESYGQLQELAQDIQMSWMSKKGLPFSRSELQSRLPLVFALPQKQQHQDPSNCSIPNQQQDDPRTGANNDKWWKILIHQTEARQTSQKDVGFVIWPSSVTLARWITQNPSLVLDAANGGILELGAGCGLVGLTVATLIQQQKPEDNVDCKLFLTDYNPTVLENLKHNLRLNDLDHKFTTVVGLDFADQPPTSNGHRDDDGNNDNPHPRAWVDMDGTMRPQVGLILAADIICRFSDATLVASTICAALMDGGQAIVVTPDSSHRYGVEQFPQACHDAGLQIEVTTLVADNDHQDEDRSMLVHDLEQTSGFTEGYHLLMFRIRKPLP